MTNKFERSFTAKSDRPPNEITSSNDWSRNVLIVQSDDLAIMRKVDNVLS